MGGHYRRGLPDGVLTPIEIHVLPAPPSLSNAAYYHLPRNPPCNRHVRVGASARVGVVALT